MLNGPCTPGKHDESRGVMFTVAGKPAPQGSKSAFATKTGRVVMVEQAGKSLHNWRDSVILAAQNAKSMVDFDELGPLTGPLHVTVDFYLPMPASRPKADREKRLLWRPQTPDIDKLTRSVLDGLTQSMLIRDDGQICSLLIQKMESTMWTGANILVYEKNYEATRAPTLFK